MHIPYRVYAFRLPGHQEVHGGAPTHRRDTPEDPLQAGTTTTDGPPVTFRVLQAHAVLTNPYD